MEYAVKETKNRHENEPVLGQVSYDNEGNFHREEEELMEERRIFIDKG